MKATAQKCVNLHNAHGVGEAGALFPAGDYDDWITGLDESTGFAKTYTKLYSIINVFHPVILGWFYCGKSSIQNVECSIWDAFAVTKAQQ